jgi:hypothetical protein
MTLKFDYADILKDLLEAFGSYCDKPQHFILNIFNFSLIHILRFHSGTNYHFEPTLKDT